MKNNKLPFILLTVCLLLVLIAYPAPSSVGVAEVLMALTSLIVFGHFLILRRRFISISPAGKLVGYLLVVHVLGWVIAGVVGMLHGVDAMSIMRSLLPQILFAPVALIGLSLDRAEDVTKIVKPLVVVALLHGLYLLGLGVFAYSGGENLQVARITFLDPRTTVPLFLALVPFGLAFLTQQGWKVKAFGLASILLGLTGALATQTRAQLLAIFVSMLVFAILYTIAWPTKKTLTLAASVVLLGTIAVVSIPTLRNLALSVVERQAKVGDNARIDEEWLPALTTWDSRGADAVLIGIGLGVPIKLLTGAENTYVHNQVIYTLVYTGLIGTVLILGLYFFAFYVLSKRYLREKLIYDAAAAALLCGLFAYGLFFAVHKLFSYNLMVFVLIALAMRGSEPNLETTQRRLASH